MVVEYKHLITRMCEANVSWGISCSSSQELRIEGISCTQLGLMSIAAWLKDDYEKRSDCIAIQSFNWSRFNQELSRVAFVDGRIQMNQRTIDNVALLIESTTKQRRAKA